MFSEKMRKIISDNNMSARASFYAGRGVTESDLNEKKLFSFHAGIEKVFGTDAAAAFVSMIQTLDDLSASSFLQALEIFDQGNGTWDPVFKDSAEAFPADKDNPMGMQLGVFLAISSTTSKEEIKQQSDRMKFHFLKTKLPAEDYKKWQEANGKMDRYGEYYFSRY